MTLEWAKSGNVGWVLVRIRSASYPFKIILNLLVISCLKLILLSSQKSFEEWECKYSLPIGRFITWIRTKLLLNTAGYHSPPLK